MQNHMVRPHVTKETDEEICIRNRQVIREKQKPFSRIFDANSFGFQMKKDRYANWCFKVYIVCSEQFWVQ